MDSAGLSLPSSTSPRMAPLQGWARLWSAGLILIVVLVSTGCATLSSLEPLSPEMLVGKWTATPNFPGDSAGPDRLLVIDSVTQSGSEWVVTARYSAPKVDWQPYPVKATLAVEGRHIVLRFRTGYPSNVELRLVNAQWLSGTLASRPIQFQKESPRAERPTYTLGEKWIRYDGLYELIRITDDRYIFATANKREIHLTRDLVVAKMVRDQHLLEVDPPPALKWPLEVGKWGTSAASWRNELGGGWPVTMTWRVVAYEEVKVVAGKFKAFRVVWSLEFPGSKRRELSTWYGPEVQQFVKAEGHDMGLLPFEVVAIHGETEPLEIVLHQPEDSARLASESVLLTGKVKTGKRLERVLVSVNGESVPARAADAGEPLQGELALELPITLQEGKNVVLVTAEDSSGEIRQEARTLFYERPSTGASAPNATVPPGITPMPSPGLPLLAPAKPALTEPADAGAEPPATTVPSAVAKLVAPTQPQEGSATPAPASAPSAALPPLHITVSSPHDQARVARESVALAGLVSGDAGISRVVVTLNGAEVSRLEEPSPRPAMAVNLPLRLQEGQNTVVVTAMAVGGRIYQEVRTVHYERLVPLTIAFRYPQDGAHVSQDSSVAAAEVTSSKGVAAATVTLNGVEVHQQRERTPQKSLLVTVPLTLQAGPNVIAISAMEVDGTVAQAIRSVTYDRPKEMTAQASPRPSPPPTPDRWAVVIGVGRYESSDIPKLLYSVSDAEAIYDVLTGPGGFKKDHVLLLTDKTEKRPTYRNLKWALGTFLARSAKKDDTVLIFFAGHGAPEVDQRGVERDGLAKYLVPSDAEADDLYSTALPMDELQTIFARIEAERVIAFLDSCYSGAAGGRTFSSKKTRTSQLDDLFLERLTRSKGRAILTASRPAEVSIELPELGHGIFTYFVVQGLKGAADLNRDEIVTLQELYEYVEQQVAQKSRAVGGNQHPMMKGELEGLLPLMRVGGR